MASPPMRGRGLKPIRTILDDKGNPSPPMRGRGLKLKRCLSLLEKGEVAPHAGAWIETWIIPVSGVTSNVAPHAGAWIETPVPPLPHPVPDVAPHAGAWIETES